MTGATLGVHEADATLAPLAAATVAMLADTELFGTADPARSYAVAELIVGGKTVSRSLIERLLPKDMAYPDPGLTLRRSGDTATITATNLARAVMIDMGDTPGQASDSGFDLLPGESVTVTLSGKQTPVLRTLAPPHAPTPPSSAGAPA